MPGPVICQSNVLAESVCACIVNEISANKIDINVFN